MVGEQQAAAGNMVAKGLVTRLAGDIFKALPWLAHYLHAHHLQRYA